MIYTLKYEDRDILGEFGEMVMPFDVIFVDLFNNNVEAFAIMRPCQCAKYPGEIGVTDVFIKHSREASKDFYEVCQERLREYGYKFIILHNPYDDKTKAKERWIKSHGFVELSKEYIKEF